MVCRSLVASFHIRNELLAIFESSFVAVSDNHFQTYSEPARRDVYEHDDRVTAVEH
jgi:hypothetical protein